MKHIKTFFAFLLLFVTLPVFSQNEPYRKDIERIIDVDGYFKKADLDEANETYGRAVDAYKFDMPVCVKKSYDEDFDVWCDAFVEENGYGYGSNKNAIVLLIETDTDRVFLKGYGAGQEIFTDDVKEGLIAPMHEYRAQNMTWLVNVWTYINNVFAVLKENEDIRNKYADGKIVVSASAKKTSDGNFPDWWPEDVENFEDFHDKNASRVVDNANIFTNQEITAMKERIKKIQDDFGFDMVVFTDTTSYGQSHALYAANFQQFNGYGFGDDYSGTVLLICMDPNNRGWWTAATGKCQGIYTEEIINNIDDHLEPYMVGGQYGEGVINYLDDIYDVYKVPEWYPKNIEDFVPFKAEDKRYCVDQIGVFTAEQQAEIERKAAEISSKYKTDFVVLTMDKTYRSVDMVTYARDFAKYNGYGVGKRNDACILCLKVNGSGTWACLASTVSEDARKCYKDKNLTNVLGHIKKDLLKHNHYDAVTKAFTYTDDLYEKNRVWHEIYFIWPIWFCIILGWIIASRRRSKNDKTMTPITDIKNPERYYVEDSFQLTGSENKLLRKYTTTHHVERPRSESHSSSRSSSSHRSSYSSSYRSSGGRSYSGGGRKF